MRIPLLLLSIACLSQTVSAQVVLCQKKENPDKYKISLPNGVSPLFVCGRDAQAHTRLPIFDKAFYGTPQDNKLIAAGTESWGREIADFNDFEIRRGATLRVRSGTVIRAQGDCKISGSIIVDAFGAGGYREDTFANSSLVQRNERNPDPGISQAAASNGTIGYVDPIYGGIGGTPITESEAFLIHRFANRAGGGGGMAKLGQGGYGGGALTLVCNGRLDITGSITARGEDGHTDSPGEAGGAGGFVILGAGGRFYFRTGGVIDVSGGNGDAAANSEGAGGGGGGGIVHIISLDIRERTGTINVSGGLGGAGGQLGATPWFGGGGGGAMGGYGGRGGAVTEGGAAQAAQNGTDGFVTTTERLPSMILWH